MIPESGLVELAAASDIVGGLVNALRSEYRD